MTKSKTNDRPLPRSFLAWQVELRRQTMELRAGAPHVGVAPLVIARRPGVGVGVVAHSVICGLLPRPDRLEAETARFRDVYERGIAEGAKHVYDEGIALMLDYYRDSDTFDHHGITTLLPKKLPLVDALRGDSKCALVFYVFELRSRDPVERLRCTHLDMVAEVLDRGPVYDNVWWHNTLFHGPADDHVVVHFRHRAAFDTCFGRFDALDG
jgi:hypothetical protein